MSVGAVFMCRALAFRVSFSDALNSHFKLLGRGGIVRSSFDSDV